MTDMITERDEVYGWETILARPVTPEESEYRTARDEAEKSWQNYYKFCDRVEDQQSDNDTRMTLADMQLIAILADDEATLLYAAWMHSDSEYQNLRYLASVS